MPQVFPRIYHFAHLATDFVLATCFKLNKTCEEAKANNNDYKLMSR